MDKGIISRELDLKAIRSSGAGGQHVNKVSTKIELSFDVVRSEGLTSEEKSRIVSKLSNKITQEGKIKLQNQQTRSLARNKKYVLQIFFTLLEEALISTKPRKKTRVSFSEKEKRLKWKKSRSIKKSLRSKPKIEE
ncbi:MAG: aminoacyl-tRNA hydrolase [Bacteroidia bacterium]|nr:aminoacyl-tRNA hydrolase [Bacteroidia bacterium]